MTHLGRNIKLLEFSGRAGLKITGLSPTGHLVEIIEIEDHPWFVGGQFHPEFKSRPTNPHPLFKDFIGAATALKY